MHTGRERPQKFIVNGVILQQLIIYFHDTVLLFLALGGRYLNGYTPFPTEVPDFFTAKLLG